MSNYKPYTIYVLQESDKQDFNLSALPVGLLPLLVKAINLHLFELTLKVSFKDEREAMDLYISPKQLNLFTKTKK